MSQTYYDKTRPRIDPVLNANVLTLFYKYNRGNDVRLAMEWVYNMLLHRAYLNGTRYYYPDFFLFALARLLRYATDPSIKSKLSPLLKERVLERIGRESDAVSLAIRIVVCKHVGIKVEAEVDYKALLLQQCEDGGWDNCWIYRYGIFDIKIGSRGVTTSLALEAIEYMEG